MPSIQETFRTAIAADPTLAGLVVDRIYPGELPDDETPSPWIFYNLPESVPFDELSLAAGVFVCSEVEFHTLADTYAEAKTIADRLVALFKVYSAGAVRESHWLGSSEEVTEEGYHHAVRFRVLWLLPA